MLTGGVEAKTLRFFDGVCTSPGLVAGFFLLSSLVSVAVDLRLAAARTDHTCRLVQQLLAFVLLQPASQSSRNLLVC